MGASPATHGRGVPRARGVGLSARAAIGLGANLGDRERALADATAALDARADTRVVARAEPREWPAEGGPEGQPPHLNGALVVETHCPPDALLAACRRCEVAAGRTMDEPWGPRALDCDLLLYDDLVSPALTLRLPHPRMLGRGFVLEPLATIAPDWVHPLAGRSIAALRDTWRARRDAVRAAPTVLAGKAALRAWRRGVTGTCGFVPTMGALHAGHRALLRVARQECDTVVVSIYVNPLQFGPSEDLARYPRDLEGDVAQCAAAGVDAVVTFTDAEMYGPNHDTRVVVRGVAEPFEGAHRPKHFEGVATVVTKLFNLVQPTHAYFGQKDAQQAAVIRRLVDDLDQPVAVEVLPTVRDADGLALSSRNAYLAADERETALAVSRGLRAAAGAAAAGEQDALRVRAALLDALGLAAGLNVDYAAIVDPETFAPRERVGAVALAIVAAHVGSTRLIDNRLCWAPPEPA